MEMHESIGSCDFQEAGGVQKVDISIPRFCFTLHVLGLYHFPFAFHLCESVPASLEWKSSKRPSSLSSDNILGSLWGLRAYSGIPQVYKGKYVGGNITQLACLLQANARPSP